MLFLLFFGLQHSPWFTNTKIGILLIVWLAFTLVLMTKSEKVLDYRQLAIPVNHSRSIYILRGVLADDFFTIQLFLQTLS